MRLLGLLVFTAACAGATVGSGVGDTVLRHPPYYAGARVPPAGPCIGHLPIAYQRGATQSPVFEPSGGPGTPVAALLAEMNAFLDSLGMTTRLVVRTPPPGRAPDVHFGCDTDGSGDCMGDVAARDVSNPELRLAVGRPSGSWVQWLAGTLDTNTAGLALVLTLEGGQYWLRQRNLRGDKEVELGTGYAVGVPRLTSLETPVSVLQLTGALVGRDGRAVRIGAEGLLARRTSLLVSAIGGQALITNEDVERLRLAHRDDLPGRPLVWPTALRHLVTDLTGGASRLCE